MWKIVLKDEHKFRMFENKVLWKNLAWGNLGDSRRLHNSELHTHTMHQSIIKCRRLWWAGYVDCMAIERGVYRVLVDRLEGKQPIGRWRQRWEKY